MKEALKLGAALVVVSSCLANEPLPYAGYCAVLDRISAIAARGFSGGAAALLVLERIAEGQGGKIGAESGAQFGLPPGMFQRKEFSEPTVRACALEEIGKTALPEALSFLAGLKRADFSGDLTQRLWPAAQTALADARMRSIPDSQSQVDFLEGLLTDPHGLPSRGAVTLWAANQLCDRGALASLSLIRSSVRASWSGQYGEDEIQFCETRIEAVRRNPDRVKALASVLSVGGEESARLQLWAIYQLDSMHSSEADAVLDQFAVDIGKLPEGSLARQRLSVPKGVIDDLQNSRRARAR